MSDNNEVSGSVLDEMFPESIGEETPPVVEPVVENPETPAQEEIPVVEEPKPEEEEEKPAPETVAAVKTQVPEGYVPVKVHAELRAKSRGEIEQLRQQLSESEKARIRYEAQAELLRDMAAKSPIVKAPEPATKQELSPLEKFNEEFPGEAVTAQVLLDQRAWDKKQETQQQAQTKSQILEQQIDEGLVVARNHYAAEKVGSEELTLDAVVSLAEQHGLITQQDKVNLAPYGNKAGMMLYSLAVNSIKTASGAPLQELNRRILVARQTLASKNGKQPITTNNQPVVKPVVPAKPAGKQPSNNDEEDDDDTDNSILKGLFPKSRSK